MQSQPYRSSYSNLAAGREAGLARFFTQTYAWMSFGLAIMGVTGYLTANSPTMHQLLFGNGLVRLLVALGWMAMTVTFQSRLHRVQPATAANMFLAYSVATGVMLSSYFLIYTGGSMARVFLLTSASFAGAASFGALTKRDLQPVTQFMMIGLIGVIVASLVNMFMRSEAIYWMSTYAMVLIFAGLSASKNQELRQMYAAQGGAGNLAIAGALSLSLSFLNLFLALLRIFGNERR